MPGLIAVSLTVPAVTALAVTEDARDARVSVDEWVGAALAAWVEAVEASHMTRLRPELRPALPEHTQDELQLLALDPDSTRLSIWLFLLKQAGWPVGEVAAPVLDLPAETIEKRAAAGKSLVNRPGERDDMLTRLPPVPEAPEEFAGDEKLAVRISRAVRDDVFMAAKALGWSRQDAIVTALLQYLRRPEQDALFAIELLHA